ncbi:MAG: WD40 repeat domain-containing protein [Planctomycetota bacterium]|jgi:hypothetical protein
MTLNLALIATIFVTRERWGAWVPARKFPQAFDGISALNADCTMAVCRDAQSEKLQIWDIEETRRVAEFSFKAPQRHRGHASFRFTADGSAICCMPSRSDDGWALSGHDSIAHSSTIEGAEFAVIDAESGRDRWRLSAPRALRYAEFLADGSALLLVHEDGSLVVIDTRSGEEICRDVGMEGGMFSPDGRRLVAWGPDCGVICWEVATGCLVFERKDLNWARYVTGEKRLVAGLVSQEGWKFVAVVDAETGRDLFLLGPTLGRTAVSRDGRLVADVYRRSHDEHRLVVWDAVSGRRPMDESVGGYPLFSEFSDAPPA